MAEEYGVRLKVSADTEEARQQMDELLDRKAQRVQDATGTGTSQPQSVVGVSVDGARRAGRAAGQEFEKTVSKGPTGAMIGKALAGFVLHQGIGTALSLARTVGGDNTNLNRAQASISGAIQYGTMGAMVGGPWGAVIGGALGAGAGLFGAYGKEREDRQNTRVGMWQNAWQNSEGVLAGFGAMAQQRLLGWQGSRENRIEWLATNRQDLQARQRKAADDLSSFSGDKTSTRYAYLQGEYQRLSSQYNQALSAEMTERMKPLYDPYGASDFSDAFSRRGLNVGASVDIQSANEKIIDQQAQMVSLLQRLVDMSNSGAAANGERLGEALREIVAATALR